MTLAHLHLLLNHVPTVGAIVALTLLIMSVIRRNEGMKRLGLELFCVIGLLTVIAYVSGLGTQQSLEEMGVDAAPIQRHHDAAFQGSVLMVLTGFISWLALWTSRRGVTSKTHLPAAIVLGALTVAMMARAASLGGEIRHPEIIVTAAATADVEPVEAPVDETGAPAAEEAPAEEPVDALAAGDPAAAVPAVAPGWFTAAFWATLVNEQIWIFPSMEALHFIALWVLFGVMIVVNARMLGFLRPASFPAVHRLLPWAAIALTTNIVTGMLFVMANPAMYLHSYPFGWKMGLLLLAGATLLYQTVFEGAWEVEAGQDSPLRVKAVAAASLVLWLGVMFFGRMLPFLGDSF
jgi:hypothetical protein